MNKIRKKLLVIISILSLPVYAEQVSLVNKYATGFAMIPGVPKDCKAI